MPLEKEFADLEGFHRDLLVAYNRLTVDKKKVAAAETRAALQNIIVTAKEMRKSVMVFKEKL